MLGIQVSAPLPDSETRLEFIKRDALSSAERLDALRPQPESWWEAETRFFDTARSRAWVVVRRIAHTSHHRGQQMAMLRMLNRSWWEAETRFFDTARSRAWVVVRRIAHTSHHRGQQMAMLRMLNRDLHSSYGPTSDTGGLMQNNAPVIYAYPDFETLLTGEMVGGRKTTLPGPGGRPPTERP